MPLVDADEPPIISAPRNTSSPVLFWMLIVITLSGSIVVASLVTTYLYTSKQPTRQTAATQSTPSTVQRGTPVVDPELEGKVLSLPLAECPLNGQEPLPGTVVVHITIDSKSGHVKSAKPTGGDRLLRDAATKAAMSSTFSPEKLRGRDTEGTITYTFEL